jgi:zinc protease
MRSLIAFALSLVFTLVAIAQPLPTDARNVQGELPSGMKYIVRKHSTPPGRAAVQMLVSTGSINETDPQRGIAHFIEHMAFNGSTHFPPGSVVPFFESLGLTFGQHQNAGTSFDTTVYQLSLNKNDIETLDKALTFMADVATQITFPEPEIEKERPIILEEKRARTSPPYRVFVKSMEQLAPALAARVPIGVEETITGVQRQDFLDYYNAWYVPSNMTLVIVADMDEQTMVDRIKAKFTSADKKPTPTDRDLRVEAMTGLKTSIATDPELTRASVGVVRITPPRPTVTTKALSRLETIENIAMGAFDRRMNQKVAAGTVAFQFASASIGDMFNAATFANINAGGEPSKWKDILRDVVTEMVRARAFGFTDDEIEFVKKELLANAEQSVSTEGTIDAAAIMAQLISNAQDGRPTMSAAQQLALLREELPTIQASEVNASFASAFDPVGLAFSLQLPSSADVPTDVQLLALGEEWLRAEVKPEAAAAKVSTLMPKLPTPGKVVESSVHEPSNTTSAWLSNGVLVHHRYMDYKKDEMIVSITLPGGPIFETADNRGITGAATQAWFRKATSTLTSNNIDDLMVGRKVTVSGDSTQDFLRILISGNPVDLEFAMQLAHLMLTDPKLEEAAFNQWKERQLQQIEAQKNNPQAYLGKLIPSVLFPKSEARLQAITKEQVERLTLADAQAWLLRAIKESPIEVSIVGDIAKDRALDLAATYLGSLPSRDRISAQTYLKERTIPRSPGERSASEEIDTTLPAAFVLGGFFSIDRDDRHEARAFDAASRILTTRMTKTLREAEGLVYGIQSNSQPAEAYKGWGVFLSAAPTDPAKSDTLKSRIFELYDDFATNGVTDEELDVAKKQAANDFDANMKEPGFWSLILTSQVYRGRKLDEVLGEPAGYQALTPAMVRDTFAKYYKPEARFWVVLKPKAQHEPTAPGPVQMK